MQITCTASSRVSFCCDETTRYFIYCFLLTYFFKSNIFIFVRGKKIAFLQKLFLSVSEIFSFQTMRYGKVYFQRFTCSFRISLLFCLKVRLLEKFRGTQTLLLLELLKFKRFCVRLFSLGCNRKQFCFKIQNVSVKKMLLRLRNFSKIL